MKHLTLFRIVYLILLGFVLIDFCLSIFSLSFTPILWDSWLFLLVITLFIRFCRHLVILDLLFGIFGIPFIPIIFKTGQFVPVILVIAHILSYCFKERYRLFEGIRSAICSLYIWIFMFVIFAFMPQIPLPITLDFEVREQEIVIKKGYLLHEVNDYHERINPFIMKSEISHEKVI